MWCTMQTSGRKSSGHRITDFIALTYIKTFKDSLANKNGHKFRSVNVQSWEKHPSTCAAKGHYAKYLNTNPCHTFQICVNPMRNHLKNVFTKTANQSQTSSSSHVDRYQMIFLTNTRTPAIPHPAQTWRAEKRQTWTLETTAAHQLFSSTATLMWWDAWPGHCLCLRVLGAHSVQQC